MTSQTTATQTPTTAHTLPVSRAERQWVFWFALAVMLVTTLPYILAYARQAGELRTFTGFLFGVEDGNSYIAKMLSGVYGAWLFRSPYTTFPQSGVFMYFPFLLLGKLAWPLALHDQLVGLYQIFRFAAGLLAILASYDFLAFFLREVRLRRFGLALAILGGGLGWLLVLLGRQNWLGSLPLEFYSPESFGFLGLFGLPHLALGRALLLWALLLYLKTASGEGAQPGMSRAWLWAAMKISLLWLLAGIMQPLDLAVLGIVLGWYLAGLALWLMVRHRRGLPTDWGKLRRMGGLFTAGGILPGLYALYNLWLALSDPYVHIWTAQNYLPSPNPLHYLVAYGLVLPFAVLGGRQLLRADPWKGWLLVGWALLLPILAYIPVGFQRRLPEGIWLVLTALAMLSMEGNLSKEGIASAPQPRESAFRRLAPFLPLLLLFPSTLFLWLGGLQVGVNPQQPAFLPASETSVFEFLAGHATPGEVALASFNTSNALPAWAPLRVLVGHGPESANQADLLPQVEVFYQPATPDSQRRDLLRRYGVRYVFWGPDERMLGDWDPGQSPSLSLFHKDGDYAVYQVNDTP